MHLNALDAIARPRALTTLPLASMCFSISASQSSFTLRRAGRANTRSSGKDDRASCRAEPQKVEARLEHVTRASVRTDMICDIEHAMRLDACARLAVRFSARAHRPRTRCTFLRGGAGRRADVQGRSHEVAVDGPVFQAAYRPPATLHYIIIVIVKAYAKQYTYNITG